ncbi:unnamed protein product [Pseudo-nitzschia multistriata]|uniref:Enhancer of yellow 2 transcription factor homolog n=1 Tax=Pseudo-nitzschia multistriata TaxID=183589 RepID=A0A448ZMH8_9STRA|nr:unnamed protein product [Pseudo-nitzschia multistriata]
MTELNKKSKPVKLTPTERKERNAMLQKLQDSGDFDRLKKSVYARLVLHPDGEAWMEGIREQTRSALQRSNGGTESIEELTLDELSAAIVAGSSGIPAAIEEDCLSRIKNLYRARDQRR